MAQDRTEKGVAFLLIVLLVDVVEFGLLESVDSAAKIHTVQKGIIASKRTFHAALLFKIL